MRQDRFSRDMKRLEEARRRTNERLQKQQQRVDARFARMQERLQQKFDEPSDTQQRIIEAALVLLKEDGLASLTQRKLATRLDMQAPALYWHFKNKEVLVDYLAEAILKREFETIEPRRDDQSWQEWLIDHMSRLRKAMLAYPDGARVVAGARLYPAVTLAKSFEYGLRSLHSAGIDLIAARRIITTATTYTFGYVIEEQAAPSEEELEEYDVNTFLEAYPYLARSFAGEERTKAGQEADYLAGLHLIIHETSGA